MWSWIITVFHCTIIVIQNFLTNSKTNCFDLCTSAHFVSALKDSADSQFCFFFFFVLSKLISEKFPFSPVLKWWPGKGVWRLTTLRVTSHTHSGSNRWEKLSRMVPFFRYESQGAILVFILILSNPSLSRLKISITVCLGKYTLKWKHSFTVQRRECIGELVGLIYSRT